MIYAILFPNPQIQLYDPRAQRRPTSRYEWGEYPILSMDVVPGKGYDCVVKHVMRLYAFGHCVYKMLSSLDQPTGEILTQLC